jgi:proteasome lid subunit RPN8/RPN11
MTSWDRSPIVLSMPLYERLVQTVRGRYPRKSFGYLVSDGNEAQPSDFLLFEENARNDDNWQGDFHSYGRYFIEHDDAGFVATPEESWRLQKEIWLRGLREVAVFHSHQRHPANFSGIDYDLHLRSFDALVHLIISLRNPRLPQLRAFSVSRAGVVELPLVVGSAPKASARPEDA